MINSYKFKKIKNILFIMTILFIFILSISFVKYYDNKKNPVLANCDVNTSLRTYKSFNEDFDIDLKN